MNIKVTRDNGYTYLLENVAHIEDYKNFVIIKLSTGEKVTERKPVDCKLIREGYYNG